MNFLEELKWRGLIKSITDEETFARLVAGKNSIYCGFDPTAASLHIGHLVPVLTLRRFQQAGVRIIAVVGSGTAMIGDPSGRSSERNLLSLDDTIRNGESIKLQLSRFIDFSNDQKAILVSNYDWLSPITLIEFLRDYGKHFPVNYMLAKDTVASRLDSGISYTEFTYMIIQAVDFLNLYRQYGCRLQLGGSDQWGNITSGVELIRRTTGDTDVVGMTLPLITKSDGTKFGKSAGGSFWLDASLTHPYAIYQYFLNTPDADVEHFLKVFTFLTKPEVDELVSLTKTQPEARHAQRRLAQELVRIMHGEEMVSYVEKMSDILFNGDIRSLSVRDLLASLEGVPSLVIQESKPLVDILVDSSLCASKREAREMVSGSAIFVNGEKVTDPARILTAADALEGRLIVLRRGKKKYALVHYH